MKRMSSFFILTILVGLNTAILFIGCGTNKSSSGADNKETINIVPKVPAIP